MIGCESALAGKRLIITAIVHNKQCARKARIGVRFNAAEIEVFPPLLFWLKTITNNLTVERKLSSRTFSFRWIY